ncbi:hypothetical protein BU24DRAFT_59432 [Aaosphaeria arxii CBS 175.79]|uniref:Uncharacterized protein n=1 Tax=Aaosphaeria arxii CBS 175.79 TaxID=1450172 RepID=A0A6A5XBY6_9PLEO|nr:uncharacterized protein BU24DRAFT_59432 [Aaosphaeria arxii CBS 175.79]KAF2010502.1 hypothetical protein BU24DRAFT_59432 [Aaosphaeria arxii CBS 175.79]
MVDTHEGASKFLAKSRWGAKFLAKDKDASAQKKQPEPKVNQNADVDDFLKPSTEKANAHKQAAAAAFLSSNRPKIDVARAQRWPGAHEVLNSAVGKSPGGLKTGTRKKGLSVSFARTLPDIIGSGGDECEEPSIEVYKRKQSSSLSDLDKVKASTHQDDMGLPLRTFTGEEGDSINQDAERRGIVTRKLTSHGELSPPLRQKMEIGHINTHVSPPPIPPRGYGPMGLGDRPKGLQRAPTGFDLEDDDGQRRPSMESSLSYDSENISPVLSRKAPSLAPTKEEDDNFEAPQLKRTQTGWSEHAGSDNDAPPPMPAVARLPEMNFKDDDSPLESSVNKYLQSEPTDPNSYSARIIQRMRQEEGRALHDARKQAEEEARRDSSSSAGSPHPGMQQPPNPFQVGTPPSSFTVPLAGRTPPRNPAREAPQPVSPSRILDPGRKHMPPGSFPLDTDARPNSSSSSQYTQPSAVSRNRGSPPGTAATSVHQSQPSADKASFYAMPAQHSTSSFNSAQNAPFSAVSQNSIMPTPPQYERSEYVDLVQGKPPVPQNHAQDPRLLATARRDTVNEGQPGQRPAPPPMSLARSNTRAQGETALSDFAERVTHMTGIFRLTAELGGAINDTAPLQWLRVATWWFLKGRVGMEQLIRSRPKTGEPQVERLTQPHVDLAKTWWILFEVVQNHPKLARYGDHPMTMQSTLAREAGDVASAEIYELHDVIAASLKMLLGSMQRHQSMPPTQALIQGQDQGIWIEYPQFAPDLASVLSGTAFKASQENVNPANVMPLGDTKADFCYFRMFVTASLSTDDLNTDRVPMPAVISVLRPRDDFKVKLSICSQKELINVAVSANPEHGPTWRDVAWNSKARSVIVQLRHGFNLKLELNEADFRSLWAIVDHTNRVEANLRERTDERFSLKLYLREMSYKDSSNPGAFPAEPVRGVKLMVFQKFERSSEGTGKRKLHRGYRLVAVTNPQLRTLSCVTHEMGTKQEPMNFEYANDPSDNAPGLKLRFREETPDKKQKRCSMFMVFEDARDRNHLFGTFTSMNQHQSEAVFAQIPLKAFAIENADQAEGFTQKGSRVLEKLTWQEVKVLNQDPEAAGLEAPPTVMSESLRFVCRHTAGIISDRMNLGPGELLVRLPIDGAAELTLLRNPQLDMALAIDASRCEKETPDYLAELLKTLTTASTIRRLTFNSFKDLHTFQLAITGFEVKFDGIASTLQISRRRMVVPIYKQWTANTIRIQIVVQDNIIQLLAFFEEFSHADAMNFQLKSMDVFEKTDKGGKPGIRLVDAKFALPVEERRGEGKMGKAEGRISGWAGIRRKYVCLDVIEYPGEHDDILISFDSAETRDRFAEALPAATMERKFTVRRKI